MLQKIFFPVNIKTESFKYALHWDYNIFFFNPINVMKEQHNSYHWIIAIS